MIEPRDRIELSESAHELELLVDALRGVSDRQLKMLYGHLSNIVLPDGQRDEEMAARFYDARRIGKMIIGR